MDSWTDITAGGSAVKACRPKLGPKIPGMRAEGRQIIFELDGFSADDRVHRKTFNYLLRLGQNRSKIDRSTPCNLTEAAAHFYFYGMAILKCDFW
jgi:hypothetical protein